MLALRAPGGTRHLSGRDAEKKRTRLDNKILIIQASRRERYDLRFSSSSSSSGRKFSFRRARSPRKSGGREPWVAPSGRNVKGRTKTRLAGGN